MDSDGPQKPSSPPPEAPRMSTFNPERQVSVLSDEPGPDSEENTPDPEPPTGPLTDGTDELSEAPPMKETNDDEEAEIEPVSNEMPDEGDDGEAQPVPDFPPPPPPESLKSEGETGEEKPLVEPEQTQPDVVVDVTDETHDVTDETPDPDSAEGAAAEAGLAEDDSVLTGDEPDPEPVNNVHPHGNFPVYRESAKRRYVQHEILEEQKDHKTGLCMFCMVIFVLLCLGALLISVIWFVVLAKTPDPVDVIEVDGDLILAEVRVTINRTFSDQLYDPSSDEYADLEEDFVKSINTVMGGSRFESNFFGTVVSGFRPGSVIVYSSLYFMPSVTIEELNNELGSVIAGGDSQSLQIKDVAVEQVRVTSEDDLKIPIRIFTTPIPATRSVTAAGNAPDDMVTDESTDREPYVTSA